MISDISLKNPINSHERHLISCVAENPKAALVIIHGFGEHGGRYQHMMEHLADHNISSLAIDLEGHGKSEAERGVCKSYEILHADVTLAISEAERLSPNVPIFLYGHSMGGGLVLNHGLTHAPKIRAYIVSAALIYPVKPVSGGLRMLVKILRKIVPKMTIANDIVGHEVSTLPEVQELYANDPLNHRRLGVGLAEDIVEGGEWNVANAEKWQAPLLMLHSRDDKLTQFAGSEEFASKAQNCTFLPLQDCEHEIHNDVSRDVVYDALTYFIETYS